MVDGFLSSLISPILSQSKCNNPNHSKNISKFITMASNSKQLHKNHNQTQWLIQITQLLKPNNLQSALQTPTSIFKIHDSITNKTPQPYSPSHIALGPYNHFKNNLNQIQLYKLENAINTRESLQLPPLDEIVDELKQSETEIRSCYDIFLDIGSEDLAWIMVLDGMFFIQLLAISNDAKEKTSTLCPVLQFPLFHEQKLYSYLIETNSITQDEISKDLIMIENQIPIVVLKNILPEKLGRNLDLLFFKFCNSVSPLQLPPHDIPDFMRYRGYTNLSETFEKSHHLLHFLYLLIMDRSSSVDSVVGMAFFRGSLFVELLNVLGSVLQIGVLQQLSEALGLIQKLFGLIGKIRSTNEDVDYPSLIPSASELKRVGVEFRAKYEDFHESIRFIEEPRKVRLELPAMTINAFSEVVLRNLIAFEAATKLNPPSFINYIALMSGLIGRAKDVKILKEAKIIESHSGSEEEEVVKLFDGLRKALELHQLSWNDMNLAEVQMVKDINGYYESCWKVKFKRFVQRFVNPILKGIFVLVVFLLVVVVVVRTFCGWFGCSRVFPVVSGGVKA